MTPAGSLQRKRSSSGRATACTANRGPHAQPRLGAARPQDDTDRGSAASDTTAFYDARDATSSVATRDDLDQWEDPPEDQHPQQVRNVLACCTLHAYRISTSRPAGGVVTL